MYKLKIDVWLHAPIVLEFENYDDARYVRQDIEHAMNMDRLVRLGSNHGYQGLMTINPTYIRTLEVVEE
ncbi:MAG: hypothetical protein IJV90_02645 [Candidatus Methanomethylophilaceae archaeon]|nr:hypothetical protein [Candidatus Methanomethylophilaceae archaeon]